MNNVDIYQKQFGLQNATFSRIDHEDAMVAVVYRVILPSGQERILKICPRVNDFLREVFFLRHFSGSLPVPRIIQEVAPQKDLHGSILMECLPGVLLKKEDCTEKLLHEIGACLARIHQNNQTGFGDLIHPQELTPDPCKHFTEKFNEGFDECANHLPKILLEQCRSYYDSHIHLLKNVDGPCIVHRDFRPGNLLVKDGKLQGIIDWASARSSFAEEDFCSLEHSEWPEDDKCKKAFFAGYASIRPVPSYKALMPLLRLSKAFATIGYTVKIGTWNTTHSSLYKSNRNYLENLFTT